MSSEPDNQRRILTHAVLVGLTPLIPIPLVDDVAKTYLLRRLVRRVAEVRGHTLSESDVETLADEPSDFGCLGCLGMAVLYPVKKIFRKIFFFLEWKRAVDTVSLVYHKGYLLDHAFAENIMAPSGPKSAADVRAALDAVLAEKPTGPVEQAIGATFRQSKSVVLSAASTLQNAVKGAPKAPTPGDVAAAVEAVKPQEEKQIAGLLDSIQQKLLAVPDGYFRDLRDRFTARLR